MAFSSSTVSIGGSTKKSDYDRLLDNTIYNKGLHTSDLILSDRGKANITLSNYDNDSAPDVKAGSVFDNNGVMIEVTSDATPTGYAGMTNSTTFYLYYDEDPGAFIYSNTAPTWSDTLQGWYNGNDRAFFSMYKDSGGTLYERKKRLARKQQGIEFTFTTGNTKGDVFDALSPYIPDVGDILPFFVSEFGSVGFGIHRSSPTVVRIITLPGIAYTTYTQSDATSLSGTIGLII